MKSFVVRVYPVPGGGSDGAAIAGIVEDPETGRQSAFHDPQELWVAISGAPRSGLDTPDTKARDDNDSLA